MAARYDATLDSEEEIEVFPEHATDPDDDNLLEAVLRIARICKNAGLKCALIGGMAFKLLGMRRNTADVDMVVEAGSREIFRAFEGERRYVTYSAAWPSQLFLSEPALESAVPSLDRQNADEMEAHQAK
jgi:hypothetical protein